MEGTGPEGDYFEEYILSSADSLSSQGFQKLVDFIVTCAHDQLFCLSQDCWNGKRSHGGERQKPPSLLQTASHSLSRALVTLKETEAHTSLADFLSLL